MTSPAVDLSHIIPPQTLMRLAKEWLAEDTPNFDPAGVCVGSKEVRATLLCKSPRSVLAGCPFFTAVFTELGCTVDWIYDEGQTLGECFFFFFVNYITTPLLIQLSGFLTFYKLHRAVAELGYYNRGCQFRGPLWPSNFWQSDWMSRSASALCYRNLAHYGCKQSCSNAIKVANVRP